MNLLLPSLGLTKLFNESETPKVKPDFSEFVAYAPALKFMWLSHSTLLLNLDGKILLIDPVFSEKCFPIDLKVDAIVISHDHYDHLDQDTILQFKDTLSGFIVPAGVGETLRDWGISSSHITELNPGEHFSFHGISLRPVQAKLFSGPGCFETPKSLCVSWILEGKSQKVFYSGDSGYGDHFRKIGDEFGPFDVTFIENGDAHDRWPEVHMLPEETIQAHLDLNGKLLVPINWSSFETSTEEAKKIANDWDIPFYTPKLAQIVTLEDCSFH